VHKADIEYLVSKFIVAKKLKKYNLQKTLEVFEERFNHIFNGWDLFNVDLIIIPHTSSEKGKTEVEIRLNGFKSYSLVKLPEGQEKGNFSQGIRNFIEFIQDNILG